MCQECSSTTTPTLGGKLSQSPFEPIKMSGDRKLLARKCRQSIPCRLFFPNGDPLPTEKRDDSSTAILRQTTSESPSDPCRSSHDVKIAYSNALSEQACINKETLLDIDDDDDQIDDYVHPSIYEE